MKLAGLKKIRVFVSLLFLLLTSLLFLDLYELLDESVFTSVLYLQFVPSFLNFISVPALLSAGFIIILLLTGFMGRVYCSSVCPVGTLIDIISHRKNRLKKSTAFNYEKPANKLQYTILAAAVFLYIGGTAIGLILLDPYSIFGRLLTAFLKPALLYGNNSLAFGLETFGFYTLSPIEITGLHIGALVIPVTTLIVILLASYYRGRLYCNSICPVGSLLGLLSRYSLFKLKINHSACTDCGACEKVCKANCLDAEKKYIDYSRCVMCFNCVTSCNSDAFVFNPSAVVEEKTTPVELNIQRRNFLAGTGAFILGLSGIVKARNKIIEVYTKNKFSILRKTPVTPPGSVNLESFADNCTACHLCVSACPTQVLQPSFMEYGFTGMMVPRLDNFTGYCNIFSG